MNIYNRIFIFFIHFLVLSLTFSFVLSIGNNHLYAKGVRKNSTSFAVGFSPGDEGKGLILEHIKKAKKTISVAAYSFTCKDISKALLKAYNRGVKVRVIVDEKSSNGKYSAATYLANHGVPVRTNSNYSIFHNKFMIFDNRHIETGSYNYSSAASQKNAENVLIVKNAPKLAKKYAHQWRILWKESTPVAARY